MKKLFTFLLLCALPAAADAQSRARNDRSTILRLRLSDGSPLVARIDGRDYHRSGTSLTIGDLPAGRHRIQVLVPSGNGRRSRRYRTVYEGTVRLAPNTFNGLTIDARSGSVDIYSDRMDEYSSAAQPAPAEGRQEARSGRTFSGGQQVNEQQAAPAAAATGLGTDAMERLRQSVAEKTADLDKLSLIKETIGSTRVNSTQVAEMLAWLSFDSSRLELAKWLYGRTTDTSNYAGLESSFSFDETKDDFKRFLTDQQGN